VPAVISYYNMHCLLYKCLAVRNVGAGIAAVVLGMQSQAIRDCQLSASESPVAGQQAIHARLGGLSGRYRSVVLSVFTRMCATIKYSDLKQFA